MINISVDISDAIAGLTDLQQRQVPYAMSRSLNDVAKLARERLISLMPSIFKFRTGTRWVRSGGPKGTGWFNLTFSTKTRLVAIIESTFDFLFLQEWGGIKTPHRASRLAVPLGKLRLKKIPPQLRPKYVLGQDLQGILRSASLTKPRSKKMQIAQFGKGFILKSNGKQFIARRVASASQAAGLAVSRPKHGTLDLMYVLVRTARIHDRLGMTRTVKDVVAREFDAAFARRMREALATAR
jgi:hypothetical protein